MTTKYKIISGFTLLVLLLIGLGTVGYMGMQKSSSNFTEYDRLAKLNVVLSDVNTNIAGVSLNLSRFHQSKNDADLDAAFKNLDTLDGMIKTAQSLIILPERLAMIKQIADDVTAARQLLNSLRTTYRDANADIEADLTKIAELEKRMTDTNNNLNSGVDGQMHQYSTATFADNAATQNIMLSVVVIGVVVGLLFALFIIWNLIRVLSRMSEYATALADGKFDHQVDVREGGEIGDMRKAMQRIPVTLHNLVNDAGNLAQGISSGRFRDRLNVKTCVGDFQDLCVAINKVSDSYTIAIDNLPVSIVTGDKNRKLLFQNTLAKSLSSHSDKAGSEESILDEALCKDQGQSMAESKTMNCEATINLNGKRADFALSTSPLHDLKGIVVGFIEILSDITQIKAQEITMRRVATNASEISDRVAAASEELAAQIEQVSRGAETQRGQMESTASAMTEMNTTVLEVARNASQASEQSENTRNNAVSGSQLVSKVVDAINQVNSIALKLQNNMGELGSQAENIGGVMNVISDIADQTNLLALNAAIEAARAGEAGRGFAVVADSVRQLAEKTMTATQEVGSNISAIQAAAKTNMREMDNAVESVREATELANSSGEALEEIVALAAATSQVVASIATAAEEQSATSEEITGSIEHVNRIVGETSDGMVQSSSAVQDLSRQAQELRRILEELQ